jgi:hypothetical protein
MGGEIMKVETYAEKRREAASDLYQLQAARTEIFYGNMKTYEGRGAVEALDKAIQRLEQTIERYDRFIAVAAKGDQS